MMKDQKLVIDGNDHHDDQIGDRCAICLETDYLPRVQLECRHTFCEGCIREWVKVKNTCPMCYASILSIQSRDLDGNWTEDIVEAPKPATADLGSDLQALDHNYFIAEIQRMLSSAHAAQRSARSVGKVKTYSQIDPQDIDRIVTELETHLELFHADVPFDPLTYLDVLYGLQRDLTTPKIQPPPPESERGRYGADDYDDLSSDEDDSYYHRQSSETKIKVTYTKKRGGRKPARAMNRSR
eukprot:TRINITY_DN11146_c0_g1_i1.p1 TRINITY_DN11146_c0_g1~~TRINITY_DN11146_c0_g1_i1.p1  ORF type:complete len:240 (+),score=51.83 TRINITY_DN11146_c0_g1_i1:211-930(+)